MQTDAVAGLRLYSTVSVLDRTVRPRDRRIYSMKRGAGAEAASRVNVAVAVSDDARSCIYEVAAACRAVGFDHTATLTAVGVFTGSMEFERLGNLRAVPGVMAVEVERDFAPGITPRDECRRRLN